MGVRRRDYAQALERQLSKGKSLKGAQKVAIRKSMIEDKYDEPSYLDKLLYKIAQRRTLKRRKKKAKENGK